GVGGVGRGAVAVDPAGEVAVERVDARHRLRDQTAVLQAPGPHVRVIAREHGAETVAGRDARGARPRLGRVVDRPGRQLPEPGPADLERLPRAGLEAAAPGGAGL